MIRPTRDNFREESIGFGGIGGVWLGDGVDRWVGLRGSGMGG